MKTLYASVLNGNLLALIMLVELEHLGWLSISTLRENLIFIGEIDFLTATDNASPREHRR